MAHFLLFYDYVQNIEERRTPFRPDHLALARQWHADGKIAQAGAFADPIDGAVFVFTVDSSEEVEQFVAADPYYTNGLVTAHRIRRWTPVDLSAQ